MKYIFALKSGLHLKTGKMIQYYDALDFERQYLLVLERRHPCLRVFI